MTTQNVDAAYLRYQYDDAEKLRIRIDTHTKYSERTSDTFASWLMEHIDPAAGQTLLDAGCGPGAYHPTLAGAGVSITGLDGSAGMVREAIAQAETGGYAVAVAVGDAARLPFRDGRFDRVMANHMLYHVPDQLAALQEFKRVVRPGGRVVLATNGADNFSQFDALHEVVASRLGYAAAAHDSARFTLEDMPLVQTAFPSAELFVREDWFVFPDAAPALRYYASGAVDSIADRPADGSHRAPMLREMEAAIDAVVAREGAFRVSKTAGCFVAVV